MSRLRFNVLFKTCSCNINLKAKPVMKSDRSMSLTKRRNPA